jgi:putative membrane protein insertion efficiency factor
VRSVLLLAIGAYQLTLGHIVGGGCRFHPSCSAYAAAAIRQVGAVRGTGLALWRVLRCSPLSRGGIDHPPAPFPWARTAAYDANIQMKVAA